MRPFTVSHDTELAPAQAWQRLTDWPRHARYVPFTTIRVTPPGPTEVGTIFVARTGRGRLAFDDPMEVVAWDPPHRCRLEKQGRVMLGWAELSIQARGAGSRVTWREAAVPAKLPRFAHGAAGLAGRVLFGRVLRGLLSADSSADAPGR